MTAIDVASPRFHLNQTVDYTDHHGRVQTGKISRIEAHWAYGKPEPLIIYTISHPTYQNRKCYRSQKEIIR